MLANISGVCQQQTQSKARISDATAMTTTSVSTVRTINLGYPRLAASAACSRSLVSPSSCAQGERSAGSVLSLLKTTVSCLVDTNFPWSVPIVVSCSPR